MNKKKTMTVNMDEDTASEDDDDVLPGEDQRIERGDAGVRRWDVRRQVNRRGWMVVFLITYQTPNANKQPQEQQQK